jgi:transposase
MAGFVEGADRAQSTLLPECLDDWVDESNPVRFIDAFVDGLDLKALASPASIPLTPAGPPITRRCT